jgi:hypothetical protein
MISVSKAGLLTGMGVLALTLAGCDRDDIHAYRAPKTTRPTPTQPAAAPTQAKVVWDAPEGWRSVTVDQPMRIATFRAGPGDGVEISVTAFPGDVGGLLANVNRWRGQVGLPPAQESDLAAMVKTTRGQSGDISLVDFTGTAGQQLLAAIVHPGDGQSWFVKAGGAPEAVGGIRGAFEKFAASIHMNSGAAASSMDAPGAPQVAPSQASGDVMDRLAAWKAPAAWAKDTQASGIVAAAFNTSNPQGAARITATSLTGEGGGILMNVNRWREQLSLAPVAALADQPATDLGPGAREFDLVDPSGGKRMIAVILTSHDQTWFFKMTGPPAAVEAEKSSFEGFVRAVGVGTP